MQTAKLYFSNNEILLLQDGDRIIPIVKEDNAAKPFPSMCQTITLEQHIHNGLTPSIIEAVMNCEFFYIDSDYSVAYNPKAIVKIELVD